MQIVILRHAETWANVEGRMQGRQNLVLRPNQSRELTHKGCLQAIALGDRLTHQFSPPTQVHLSPSRRVQETWNAFPNKPTCPISFNPQLYEIDQGILSGLTWAEASTEHPKLCQKLLSQSEWLPIPESESPTEARKRAEHFLDHLYASTTDSDRVWIMTHGGFIPYLVSTLLGSDRTWGISVALTALFEFSVSHSPARLTSKEQHNLTFQQIKFFNDTRHAGVMTLKTS